MTLRALYLGHDYDITVYCSRATCSVPQYDSSPSGAARE